MRRLARVGLAACALLLAACVTPPQATGERDALAKEFLTDPNTATIYVYRSPFNYYDTDSVLFLNGRLIGATVPGGYFRLDTVPGQNVLHGTGLDVGHFSIDARPGQIYVVAHQVVGGQSTYQIVPEQVGQQRVRACCVLYENGVAHRAAIR